MYVPKNFELKDHDEAVAFIKRYSFGTLVTVAGDAPVATHIPFVVSQGDNGLKLTSHIALANPQWKTLTGNKVLAIFTEPHAYISPSHYEKEQSVPTWNYIAVHAYGHANLIDKMDSKLSALNDMINFYNDEAYLKQWKNLPIDYKTNMAKGIVAFDIMVDELQGQKKLSQNKTQAEQQNIIATLSNSEDTVSRDVAGYMKKEREV